MQLLLLTVLLCLSNPALVTEQKPVALFRSVLAPQSQILFVLCGTERSEHWCRVVAQGNAAPIFEHPDCFEPHTEDKRSGPRWLCLNEYEHEDEDEHEHEPAGCRRGPELKQRSLSSSAWQDTGREELEAWLDTWQWERVPERTGDLQRKTGKFSAGLGETSPSLWQHCQRNLVLGVVL